MRVLQKFDLPCKSNELVTLVLFARQSVVYVTQNLCPTPHCVHSASPGYAPSLFRRSALAAGLRESDYVFMCMSWDSTLEDIAAPNGICDGTSSGVPVCEPSRRSSRTSQSPRGRILHGFLL